MIADRLKTLFGGKSDAFTEIEKLRAEILLGKAEAAELKVAPIPRADAEAALDQAIARLGESGVSALTSNIAQLIRPERSPDFAPKMPSDAIFGMLVAVAPQAIRAAVSGELDRVYANRKPLPDMPARKARMAELAQSILAAELREESLIRQLEAADVAISRRSDADPRAVLALIET